MVWRLLSLWEEPLWRVVYKPLLQALKRIIPAIWKKNMGVYNPPAHMGKRADRKKNLWSLQIFDQKMPLDWGNHSLRHSQIYFYVGTLIYQTFWKLYRLAMSQEIRNHKWQWIYPPVGVLQLCMCIHISIYIYTGDIHNRVEFWRTSASQCGNDRIWSRFWVTPIGFCILQLPQEILPGKCSLETLEKRKGTFYFKRIVHGIVSAHRFRYTLANLPGCAIYPLVN